MRTRNSKSFFFLTLLFTFTLISISSFSPYVNAESTITSNDLIKNFKIESFDGQLLTESGQTNDGKLQFEPQASWNIYPDDIMLSNIYTIGDDVYINYKVAMTSKVNMYTTVDVNEGAENNQLNQVEDMYLVGHYEHLNWIHLALYWWSAYLTWNHWDFGNIKQWNAENNDFEGDLVMSFDIAQNLLPNFATQSGDAIMKNFDYIAVSSIAVNDNIIGKLDDSAPTIVGLVPREYDSGLLNSATEDDIGPTEITYYWNTDVNLEIYPDPLNSFDGGIIPQSVGTSMNPRRKDGGPIWDPELEQSSMTDARFTYHIGSLSPLVTEYYAALSYNLRWVIDKTTVFLGIPIGLETVSNTIQDYTYTKPIALHVTNRYIQTEIRVVFDIFTSYKIDVGSDNIEDYNLDFPREYYDLLLWLITVDGFGGGEQTTKVPTLLDSLWWIIILIIVIIVVLFFYKFGGSIIRGRQRRKEIETIMRGKR